MDQIELGFNLPSLIALVVFLAAFASVMAVTLPFVMRDSFANRLRSVAERRQELRAKQQEKFQQRRTLLPARHEGMMRAIVNTFKMENLLQARELRLKLMQAGWRHPSTPVKFIFARIALPIGLALGAFIYMYVGEPEASMETRLGVTLVAAVIGYYAPILLLANTIQKRQQALRRGFPDTLDLMVICVEAGMSIEAAFQKVTEEMAESAPQLAEEIGLTAAELAFLGDRAQAFQNLADRVGLRTFKSLATTLVQSEKYGTPIAVGLRVIAQENRDERMMAAEKKAASLPAKLTVPMIVFFLPVLFIVIIGPIWIKVSQDIFG
ncbi:tight adherence protein C [Dongia mobilis]|uniref:Tight adherence protein C n=1 Tax=Dongia mobilis TaxID=578943 RepID=A0A4R6WFV7_9PROT|nr:type II secretion system F family protein [Dongia mobilis]TDQ78946.1 tight adherence protein C [Dongia mobilis]